MDFLAENNSCGQTLLRMVAKGNATIAELLRLKDVVPTVYSRVQSRADRAKYGDLIQTDFTYFKTAEQFENRVEQSDLLQQLDEELKQNHLELLTRFYRLFESIYRFVVDLNGYIADLEDGVYIQQMIETVFLDGDGKQLMCEALYLYGVMLLLTDAHIDGVIRERLLVAYYRYCGQGNDADGSNIDDICKLLRSTGFSASGSDSAARRSVPQGYPDHYFARLSPPANFVRMAIGRLRSDDVYHQLACYPDPEQRSTALSLQAAMLYVSLYFAPEILREESAAMREIVDKFFPDNWVIAYYMGTVVNLAESWDPYKAAKAALTNTMQAGNVKAVSTKVTKSFERVLRKSQKMVKEGELTEENVLDLVSTSLSDIRQCNVTLRWLMLHTNTLSNTADQIKKCRQLRDQVISETKFDRFQLFQLLLNTSQFELKFRNLYKRSLEQREQKWAQYKKDCRERLLELSDVYGGGQPLSRVKQNSRLQNWFSDREKQVKTLDLADPAAAARLAVQISVAITEALEFDQIESNLQVKQSLSSVKQSLHQLIKTAGVKEDVLVTLGVVGEVSYAWEIVDCFTLFMQQGVKKEPSLVGKLRTTFLKLSTALEGPVLRISQARSKDFVSVSQYYSSELVGYVRRVLQIIPETVFEKLDQIIRLQTDQIKEVPTRLDKDKLRDYAQLDERFEVARLTHSISVFTEGMLAMKSTLVGVIKVDPKRLLEDGIRKELVRQVSQALNTTLTFNPKAKNSEIFDKLAELSKTMAGFKRSFEYIQDYVSISGLKIWQEELSRIINFNVEQEANLFLRQKTPAWASVYQSKSIPIPIYQNSGSDAYNFIGRLANEIISCTSPKSTIYVKPMQTWYDCRSTHAEVASLSLFSSLESAVGTIGLAGLDRLLGLKAVTTLQNLTSYLDKTVFRDKSWVAMLENLGNSLSPTENVVAKPAKFYADFVSPRSKVTSAVLDYLVVLGQLQLLRKQIAYRLAMASNFDAKVLNSALKAFNRSVVGDLKDGKVSSSSNESELLYELSTFLQWSGIVDPKSQVYVTVNPAPKMAELVFIVVVSALGKVAYSNSAGVIISKRPQDPLDGHSFALGCISLLQQYSDSIADTVLTYLAQYARSFADANSQTKNLDLPLETHNVVHFLDLCAAERQESRGKMAKKLPMSLLDLVSRTSTT